MDRKVLNRWFPLIVLTLHRIMKQVREQYIERKSERLDSTLFSLKLTNTSLLTKLVITFKNCITSCFSLNCYVFRFFSKHHRIPIFICYLRFINKNLRLLVNKPFILGYNSIICYNLFCIEWFNYGILRKIHK